MVSPTNNITIFATITLLKCYLYKLIFDIKKIIYGLIPTNILIITGNAIAVFDHTRTISFSVGSLFDQQL